jgi:hypothetical protein
MNGRWKSNFGPHPEFGANAIPPGARVIVEMEGVLYDDSAWERWLFQLLVRMGIRGSFDGFRAVWRRDYLANVPSGSCSFELTLRRFLAANGMSDGTIHEVCAAAVCRHRHHISHPVLFPGVAGPILELGRLGVHWTAVHRSARSSTDWGRTLQTWRLSKTFDRIYAWPEVISGDDSHVPVPPVLSRLVDARTWYVSCDPTRLTATDRAGFMSVGYGTDGGCCRVACLSELGEILRRSAVAPRRAA